MPINEILAPTYVKVHYTSAFNQSHVLRFYFNGTAEELSAGWFEITPVAEDPFLLDEFIHDEFTVRSSGAGMASGWNLDTIEVWASAEGVNTFLGYQDVRSSGGYNHGSGTPIAASYTMNVYAAGDRSLFRFSMMDSTDAKPQRTPGVSPPVLDDDSLGWMFIKGHWGLVTNDNKLLRVSRSINTGYNRKLARSYGRLLTP